MIDLGLTRIAQLTRSTPTPWRTLHISGTNGKGSICAYLSALLSTTPLRTARFTSPHLLDRWDAIHLSSAPISRSAFLLSERTIHTRNTELRLNATPFELLTATAFEAFTRAKVDVAVVECGLGGARDATNVLENKCVTVIAKIGLDHQSLLGSTLEAIAAEKAGIMRPNVPCVIDSSNAPCVLDVCARHAARIGAPLILSSQDSAFIDEMKETERLEPHQWENLATAYTAFNIAYTGKESPLHRLVPAVKGMVWPGRLQVTDVRAVNGRREVVLLDGAHNEQSAGVLGGYVDTRLRPTKHGSEKRVTWVLSASNGKDLQGLLKPLLRPGDGVAAVAFGAVDGMPWVSATPPSEILEAARQAGVGEGQLYNAENDVGGALRWAAEAAAGGPLVIAGSLYLVGDVLRLVRRADEVSQAFMGSVRGGEGKLDESRS